MLRMRRLLLESKLHPVQGIHPPECRDIIVQVLAFTASLFGSDGALTKRDRSPDLVFWHRPRLMCNHASSPDGSGRDRRSADPLVVGGAGWRGATGNGRLPCQRLGQGAPICAQALSRGVQGPELVSRTILLDSGPLGLITNPGALPLAASCGHWVVGAIRGGAKIPHIERRLTQETPENTDVFRGFSGCGAGFEPEIFRY